MGLRAGRIHPSSGVHPSVSHNHTCNTGTYCMRAFMCGACMHVCTVLFMHIPMFICMFITRVYWQRPNATGLVVILSSTRALNNGYAYPRGVHKRVSRRYPEVGLAETEVQ